MGILIQAAVLAKAQRRKGRQGETPTTMAPFNSLSKTINAGPGSKAAPRQGITIPITTSAHRASAAAKNYFGSFSARWANCRYKLMEK
jgi:hypothetical protein